MAKMAAAFLMFGLLFLGVFAAIGPVRAADKSYNLYGSVQNGWGLSSSTETFPGPELTVRQGDVVEITLHSTDGDSHQFFIDLNHNDVPDSGEPMSTVFTTTATITFTASTVGTFDYFCYFHETSMKGDFVVESSGSAGTTTPAGTDNTLLYLGIGSVVVVAGVGAAAAMMMRKKK